MSEGSGIVLLAFEGELTCCGAVNLLVLSLRFNGLLGTHHGQDVSRKLADSRYIELLQAFCFLLLEEHLQLVMFPFPFVRVLHLFLKLVGLRAQLCQSSSFFSRVSLVFAVCVSILFIFDFYCGGAADRESADCDGPDPLRDRLARMRGCVGRTGRGISPNR